MLHKRVSKSRPVQSEPLQFLSTAISPDLVLLPEYDDDGKQVEPPQLFFTAMLRVLTFVPPPHLTEHDPNELHVLHWQFTGQHCVLHELESDDDPEQLEPPQLFFTVMLRVLIFDPPPHLAEHDPK